MALWLVLMFLGLGVLGFVFYKVWTAPSTGVDRRWLFAALGGTLVAVLGLVMTLRSFQKSSSAFIPQATIQQPPPAQVAPGGTPGSPGGPAAPGSNTITVNPQAGIPTYDPAQFPVDPQAPSFTAPELAKFVQESNRIIGKLEEQVAMDNDPNNKETPQAKANRWALYYMDHEQWLRNLRTDAEGKKGPNSGRVRQLVFKIAENLEKMERVYQNSAVLDDPLDLSYISDLRGEVENLNRELEKQGGGR